MKLPEYILDKLYDINRCGVKMHRWITEVETYLEKQGYTPEEYRCGDGRSLEEFEYGCGDLTEFQKLLDDIDKRHREAEYEKVNQA